VESFRLTKKLHPKLPGLSQRGDGGIPGVAVKCVDIGRKAGGEGGHLALN
jgi:hypothetical protein